MWIIRKSGRMFGGFKEIMYVKENSSIIKTEVAIINNLHCLIKRKQNIFLNQTMFYWSYYSRVWNMEVT